VRTLNARERRLIAVAVLLAAVALIWLGIVWPVVGGFYARASERRQLQATYLRNERLMAALPAWRAAAEAEQRSAARFTIAAPSEQLAAEVLKDRVQHLAADEGFALTSVQDLQADAPAGAVRIRADMQMTLIQLCDSLRRLETEGAYVIVDYLSISADRALTTGHLSPIDVRVELTAAYAPAGPRPH
jgi:hypothetical protein